MQSSNESVWHGFLRSEYRSVAWGEVADPESAKPLGIHMQIVHRLEQEIAWSGGQKKVRCSTNISVALSLDGGVVVVPKVVRHPVTARMISPNLHYS
jgi:hypothetical protein